MFPVYAGTGPESSRLELQANPPVTQKKRDEAAFARVKPLLDAIKVLAREGKLKLVYYDEAGFQAASPLVRAWSLRGEYHATLPGSHQRINVMGALDFGGQQLFHEEIGGTVTREHFIRFMDTTLPRLASTAPAVTMIVLDNARIHHDLPDSVTLRWMEQHRAVLFYLPPYSPELNMIEILWKQAKYYWRQFCTWTAQALPDNVASLLNGFGSEYQISFD